ncbi:hypothetical protein ACJRPK_13905 [Aquimarina sp. 2-A2]|uniref:hypothetical protein n=1 Tax=Aquimarina sp. 2-A2 TaxID=3382644 RepID=UPI00387F0F01
MKRKTSINPDILDKAEELTDEKYDWLEQEEADQKANGVKFDIDRSSDVWYTMKIAELQLAQENTIKGLDEVLKILKKGKS